MNRRIILCLAMFVALTASARSVPPQSSGDREFVGTINKTLKIRMRLSQSGKTLSGSYAYERIGKSLRLDGAMTSENEFYLNEFDEGGTQTGKFDGKFVSKDWLEGTWSSTTKKELPFSAQAIDGQQIPAASAGDRVSGRYRRVNDDKGGFDRNSAEVSVWLLKDGQARVVGYSSWVGNAKTGNVNVGQVDGVFGRQGSKLFFKDGGEGDGCHFTITFGADSLLITDDSLQCGGINVTFDGKYRKVGPAKSD